VYFEGKGGAGGTYTEPGGRGGAGGYSITGAHGGRGGDGASVVYVERSNFEMIHFGITLFTLALVVVLFISQWESSKDEPEEEESE
jgi:hypothetical protein